MTKKKVTIKFRESLIPITEFVTKFGGQPVWVEKPEWAVSRSTGRPMRFICQIALDKEVFGNIESKMAYIFITDDEEYVDGTWEADGGENAVIVQPDGNNPPSIFLETGPILYEMKKVEGESLMKPFDCEFLAQTSEIEDDVEIEDDEMEFENKVGGIPMFLQGEQFPNAEKENWNLLLQLDSASIPFYINFGDAGVGYAFISNDGKTGKFLWQCC